MHTEVAGKMSKFLQSTATYTFKYVILGRVYFQRVQGTHRRYSSIKKPTVQYRFLEYMQLKE